jgi:hypothetical protein
VRGLLALRDWLAAHRVEQVVMEATGGHMLSTGETYRDLGTDYFTQRDPQRQTKRLVKQLERLGHHVTLTDEAAMA